MPPATPSDSTVARRSCGQANAHGSVLIAGSPSFRMSMILNGRTGSRSIWMTCKPTEYPRTAQATSPQKVVTSSLSVQAIVMGCAKHLSPVLAGPQPYSSPS